MVGGQRAITAETEALWLVEHTLVAVAHAQAGGKGKKPEPRQYPEGVLTKKAKAEAKKAISRAKAARFLERHKDD